jgi:hypothetical protein
MEPNAPRGRHQRAVPERRRRGSRGGRRVAGLLATVALLGVGVASASMVLPDGDDGAQEVAVAAPTEAPTATATPAEKARKKPRVKPLTKAELAERDDAVDLVREQGFTTLKRTDYDPRATLRVLVGRPVGDAAGGHRAFFFNEANFIGNDASAPSSKLSVSRTGKVTVTLSYGVYEADDLPGDPSDRKRVRFRLQDGALVPLDTIPEDSARFIPRG